MILLPDSTFTKSKRMDWASISWRVYIRIESLRLYAGIHRQTYRDFHRLLSKRFPFAIYYKTTASIAYVHAVADCRRSPAWIREHLG